MICSERSNVKRKIILLLLSLLCLLGIGGGFWYVRVRQSAATTTISSDLKTIEQLADQDLKKPDQVIESLDDFIYTLNYLAFYRIDDKLYFTFSKEYEASFYNPYTEFQKAYTQADLADVYASQMDDSLWSKDKVIGIKYSISKDIASSVPENIPTTPITPSFDVTTPDNPLTTIPLEADKDKEEISCETSEQLYWLVMNGYKPKPVKGSRAEALYQEAKTVLQTVVGEDMDTFQQIKAVYDWLTTEVLYDYETAYSLDTYLVKEQAYYLEGVFFNHYAVCDGKSKAYALLLNMLGIPCYRDTGQSENGDHAWNMVQYEGKWYISCTTYGQNNASDSLGTVLPQYAMLLTSKETAYKDEWLYESQKHLDISSQLETTAYPVYEKMSTYLDENLQVSNMEQTKTLLTQIAKDHTAPYKVEFEYTGGQTNFESDLIAYLSTLENVNAIPIKSEGGQVYQVIYLKK